MDVVGFANDVGGLAEGPHGNISCDRAGHPLALSLTLAQGVGYYVF